MISTHRRLAEICAVCKSAGLLPFTSIGNEVAISQCAHCGVACGEHDALTAERRQVADHFRGLDEARYLRSVGATRMRSYDRLLREVKGFFQSGTWLDVGSSYGWLLERVGREGFDAQGIEPSMAAVNAARARGLQVTAGLFPNNLPNDLQPNVISFMDVLEHLPDPVTALISARERLAPNGIVVVQVPDQACLLYQLANAMCRLTQGRGGFALRRLWLVGFDFPHRYYFTRRSLGMALTAAGLQVQRTYRTPIGSPREALDRISYTESGPPSLAARGVALAVGGINALDAWTGYGGLLTTIATPAPTTMRSKLP